MDFFDSQAVNKPVFDPGYPIIDANVLFDKDGKLYLYYSCATYKPGVKSEYGNSGIFAFAGVCHESKMRMFFEC